MYYVIIPILFANVLASRSMPSTYRDVELKRAQKGIGGKS
jgi:hypothetical protein